MKPGITLFGREIWEILRGLKPYQQNFRELTYPERGYWVIKKKTVMKRHALFMKGLWRWCKENHHESINQHKTLCAKLRGFYQYYGVRCNYKALEVVFEYAEKT